MKHKISGVLRRFKAVFFAAIVALSASVAFTQNAFADGTAYFTLPADFADNVTATIVGVAGTILVILGLMFAWRKTVKSTNRS